MTFSIGQKIVCVRDTWIDPAWAFIPNKPLLNGIYTVRDFEPRFIRGGELAIRLVEIINPLNHWRYAGFIEGAFGVDRFRPLVERKTDISIFTKMLTPQLERERA